MDFESTKGLTSLKVKVPAIRKNCVCFVDGNGKYYKKHLGFIKLCFII